MHHKGDLLFGKDVFERVWPSDSRDFLNILDIVDCGGDDFNHICVVLSGAQKYKFCFSSQKRMKFVHLFIRFFIFV
jgi:hypothetical protein